MLPYLKKKKKTELKYTIKVSVLSVTSSLHLNKYQPGTQNSFIYLCTILVQLPITPSALLAWVLSSHMQSPTFNLKVAYNQKMFINYGVWESTMR